MFSNKADTNKTKTIDALIPMIDLFAVLAIVFMIYSSDEIIAEQEKSQRTIEEIATEYKKLQEELAAAEEARERRRELVPGHRRRHLGVDARQDLQPPEPRVHERVRERRARTRREDGQPAVRDFILLHAVGRP